MTESPNTGRDCVSYARMGAAGALFAWLVVELQYHLVNFQGWSPLLFLWLGIGVGLIVAIPGFLFGWFLERLRGKVMGPMLGVAAILVPAGAVFILTQYRLLKSEPFSARADVVASGTRTAYLLATGGMLATLAIGRRMGAPLPSAVSILVMYVALGFLAHEPGVEQGEEKAVTSSLVKGTPMAPKLLVVGSDGLDWSVIVDLSAQGMLPNFAALQERAAHAPYQTMEPTLSPIIWNTMATGVPWEEHGVREFIYFALPGAKHDGSLSATFLQPIQRRLGRQSKFLQPYMRLAGSVHRRRLAFWQVFDLVGINTMVTNWWATHPAGETGGLIISDQAVETGLRIAGARDAESDEAKKTRHQQNLQEFLESAVQPSTAVSQVLDVFEPEALRSTFAEAREILGGIDFGVDGGIPQKQVERYARALIHGDLVAAQMGNDSQEVYVWYDRLTDQISHLYWQFYRPHESVYGDRAPTPESIAGLGDMVPAAYRTFDRVLGELLVAAGPDTNVLIVSDHGFSPIYPPRKFQYGKNEDNPPRSGHHHHGEPGVFLLAGPGVCTDKELGQVGILDFMPTVMYLRGLPIADNLKGRIVTEAICDDWLSEHPHRTVPTYEYDGWRDSLEAAAASAESLGDLAELGYLND